MAPTLESLAQRLDTALLEEPHHAVTVVEAGVGDEGAVVREGREVLVEVGDVVPHVQPRAAEAHASGAARP